jgi:hypothetical protein
LIYRQNMITGDIEHNHARAQRGQIEKCTWPVLFAQSHGKVSGRGAEVEMSTTAVIYRMTSTRSKVSLGKRIDDTPCMCAVIRRQTRDNI